MEKAIEKIFEIKNLDIDMPPQRCPVCKKHALNNYIGRGKCCDAAKAAYEKRHCEIFDAQEAQKILLAELYP